MGASRTTRQTKFGQFLMSDNRKSQMIGQEKRGRVRTRAIPNYEPLMLAVDFAVGSMRALDRLKAHRNAEPEPAGHETLDPVRRAVETAVRLATTRQRCLRNHLPGRNNDNHPGCGGARPRGIVL